MSEQNQTDQRQGGWLSRERASVMVLVAATALALYVCYRLARPFLPAITWALTLSVVAHPLHKRIAGRVKKPSLAATLSVIIVAVVVVAPGIFMGRQLVSQAGRGLAALKAQTESGQWRTTVESSPQLARALSWVEPYWDVRGATERVINAVASNLASLVGGTIYATVYGTFVVAIIQGVLGGLMFWWLGLPAPLLWGIVMALLALIPVLGAPVVWIPAAIFLAVMGNWGKALILMGWGIVVIGTIENLLYPILVG